MKKCGESNQQTNTAPKPTKDNKYKTIEISEVSPPASVYQQRFSVHETMYSSVEELKSTINGDAIKVIDI